MSRAEIYFEKIHDHDRNPRNNGWIDGSDITAFGSNPLCGDQVTIQVKLDKGTVGEVAFTGIGCAISQAATSMLTEMVKGKRLNWVEKMSDRDIFALLGKGDVQAYLRKGNRTGCALLGIRALKDGVANYYNSRR